MEAQILAYLKVGGRTFAKSFNPPIDPVIGMKSALTCEDKERGVFAKIDVQITDLIFMEETNQLICNMKHFHGDTEFVLTSLFESDNWGAI